LPLVLSILTELRQSGKVSDTHNIELDSEIGEIREVEIDLDEPELELEQNRLTIVEEANDGLKTSLRVYFPCF
jgi:hypothetical protein